MGTDNQGTLLVQYWRSMEHLQAYARSRTNKHNPAWKILFKKGKETTDYGFWHEAFEVKAGKYDAIYVNMPPILLGNCVGTEIVDCSGKNATSKGRTGMSAGEDWPEEFEKAY